MRRIAAALLLALLAAAGSAGAAVTASDIWIRATVPGQQVAAGYLKLRSDEPAALVAVASPAAGRSEIHEMTMHDGVMKMRPISRLSLPAGRTVELRPGGYHLMLMQLPQPLKAGDRVSLTLTIERENRQREEMKVEAEVRAAAGAAPPHRHGH